MPRPWPSKFRDAFQGLWLAVRSERSFSVHVPAAVAALIAGAMLRVSLPEACVLGLCVTVVVVAEVFNTALEYLAREITKDERPGLAAALNMSSGGVLLASIGAAAIGATIFGYRLGVTLKW